MHDYFKFLPMLCLIASSATQAKDLDKNDIGRCSWGGSMMGLAQSQFLAGKPLAKLLGEMQQVKYPEDWMAGDMKNIVQATYENNLRDSPEKIKAAFIEECIQYHLNQ